MLCINYYTVKFQATKMSAIKNVSFYIPHVFPNFTKEYVADVFAVFGEVDHVDFVAKQDKQGKDYNAAYIHLNKWYNNAECRGILSHHEKSAPYKVYHDGPWYWIVLPNTAKKQVSGDRKPRIDLGDAKAISCSNVTPIKAKTTPVCPGAPKKPSYAQVASNSANQSLQACFDEVADLEADFDIDHDAQMDEIEELLDAEDANLVQIDGRYVEVLEQENWGMRSEIAQLRAALINLDQMYQAEAAKVRAFSGIEV